MKRPTKRKVLQPDPRSDLGPLPWLLAFANIGFDDRHARGPFDKLDQSRSLGYGGKRGMVLIEEMPYSVAPGEPWGDRVTQEDRRGITKTWLRLNVGGKEVMIPDTRGLEAPMTVELLQNFWADFPPRLIMPVPEGTMSFVLPHRLKRVGGEHGRDACSVEEIGATPLGEEILRCFQDVRFVVRVFLKEVRDRCREIDAYQALLPQAVIEATVNMISLACMGRLKTLPPWPDVGLKIEGVLASISRSIWENSAPVSMQMKRGESHYISDGLPGIAWAEVLNLVSRRHLWEAFECCGWCGRFFLPISRRRRRPREYCSVTCRRRLSDYALDEARTFGPRSHY